MANPNPAKPVTRINRLKPATGQVAISVDGPLLFNSSTLRDDFIAHLGVAPLGAGIQTFASGGALLAGTAIYAGQIFTAVDGAFAFTNNTLGVAGGAVCLNPLIYFNTIRPGIIDANATSDPGAFQGGAHRLRATGVTFLDNTLVLGNETGGYAAVTLYKVGEICTVTLGTLGARGSSEYNGCYLATNSPDGGVTDPETIGLYQEQAGRGTHRRILANYTAKTVTCYGLDLAGAVTGVLVADPVGWQVNGAGEMGVMGAPEGGKALKVHGDLVVTGAITGDGSGLTGVGGMAADSGWTANASAGDKTQVVADYNSVPMFTGADTVSLTDLVAMGQQLQAVTRKLQALEAALASDLRPNA